MRLGAVIADASEADEANLAAYGRAVGLAFQIVDDVLDLTATEEVLANPWPAICARASHAGSDSRLRSRIGSGPQDIQRVLDDRSFENVSRQQIQEILIKHGSVEYARAAATATQPIAPALASFLIPTSSAPCSGSRLCGGAGQVNVA